MERFDWSEVASREAALARPRGREDAALLGAVRGIVDDVRTRGWAALVEQSVRIDGAAPERIAVAPFAERARTELPAEAVAAMALAAALQARGFDLRGIRPPTVPHGTSRLRLSLTVNASEGDIVALAQALEELWPAS